MRQINQLTFFDDRLVESIKNEKMKKERKSEGESVCRWIKMLGDDLNEVKKYIYILRGNVVED